MTQWRLAARKRAKQACTGLTNQRLQPCRVSFDVDMLLSRFDNCLAPHCSQVEVCCFDKTGTLTTDHLLLEGLAGLPGRYASECTRLMSAHMHTS